ncbi:autotransporter outer membrane beta-barrel domain-containing protein [Chryseobacterium vrystaatense]|uniref:hypothetical protein n=1 Tax=Chryseobacterium vrystaatense TaxID=307480 RepID=UPI00068A3CB5|nr:hypothetical protein [Chryseobacterium vrystaatense]
MKKEKLILSAGVLFFSMSAYSQVGMNTASPAATFDITAQNATGNSKNVDGLLIPRVDRERAQNMTGIPISTLIYVNGIVTGDTTGNAVNIDAVGYYYYTGTVWEKLITPASANTNIYVTDGNLNDNRTVAQGDKTLTFTGTKTNAFSVDGATFSVDAANDRVGVGTATPSVKLHVVATASSWNRYNLFDAPASNGEVNLALRNTSALAVGNQSLIGFTNSGPDSGGANWGIGSIRTGATATNGTEEAFYIGNSRGANYIERFRIDPSGNLGAGTSTPQKKLHVNGSFQVTSELNVGGSATAAGSAGTTGQVLTSNGAGAAPAWTTAPASVNMYNANGTIDSDRTVAQGDKTLSFTGTKTNAFSVDGTTLSVDAANDRVGIGTSAPQNKLDLGATAGSSVTDVAGKKLAVFNNASGTDFYGLGVSSLALQFHAAAVKDKAPGMVLSSSGNVGIGTSAPHATLEVASAPGNNTKADGIIPPRLKGSELKAKDGAYGIDQTGAVIYVTEGLAAAAITAKTKNVTVPGYYYFNGTEWMRFNDVGAAPLTKVAFNGMGSAEPAMIAGGMSKKLSFPVTNITADAQIGTWNSTTSEMTVSKKGVYTITASLVYQNVATTGGATLTVRGGSDSDSSSSVAIGGAAAPYTQRNNITSIMVLNAGEKIWIEGFRNNSAWSVGKRSLNITFSEIN